MAAAYRKARLYGGPVNRVIRMITKMRNEVLTISLQSLEMMGASDLIKEKK